MTQPLTYYCRHILFAVIVFFVFSCEVKIERRKKLDDANISISNFIAPQSIGIVYPDSILFFANGKIKSDKIPLKPGTYTLLLNAKGTQAYNVYPKVKIYLGDRLVSEPQLAAEFALSSMVIRVDKEEVSQLSIQFDSDGLDDKGNDRNVIIRSISLKTGELSKEEIEKEGIITATAPADTSADDGILDIKDLTIASNTGKLEPNGDIHMLSNGAAELKKAFPLEAGNYNFIIEAKGTRAYGVYPKIKIFFNDAQAGEVQLLQEYISSPVPIKISTKDNYKIRIVFDSDGLDDKGNDRDVFIKSIHIEKHA